MIVWTIKYTFSGKILYLEGRGEVLPKFWGGQFWWWRPAGGAANFLQWLAHRIIFFSFLLYLSDISELYCSDPSSILAGEISFTSRVGGKCCRNFGVVNWLEFFGGWGGSAAEILVGGIVSTYWWWWPAGGAANFLKSLTQHVIFLFLLFSGIVYLNTFEWVPF